MKSRFINKLKSLSISEKIIFGNSFIIIMGAIAGTLITRHLTNKAADPLLIVAFASVGVLVSVISNIIILNSALKPLDDIIHLVNQLQKSPHNIEVKIQHPDPDMLQLVEVLNSLVTEVQKRNLELQALSKQAIHAQEDERKRIAQSLHDDTGQALSSLIFNLERIEHRLSDDQEELRIKIASCRALASDTLRELRKIMLGLRPSILDDLGLIPAIRWYGRSNLEEAGIQFEFSEPTDLPPLPNWVTVSLFRIAQEAINNIIHHSRASAVKLSLDNGDSELILTVTDNGIGFKVDENNQEAIAHQHWGILGMRERAETMNAKFEIESNPGKGTTIRIRVPKSGIINGIP